MSRNRQLRRIQNLTTSGTDTQMRKITGRIASFIMAAALVTFASACTSSPLAPEAPGDGPLCYYVNGTLVCY